MIAAVLSLKTLHLPTILHTMSRVLLRFKLSRVPAIADKVDGILAVLSLFDVITWTDLGMVSDTQWDQAIFKNNRVAFIM